MRRFDPDIISIQFLWTNAFYSLLTLPFIGQCGYIVTVRGPIDVAEKANEEKPHIWKKLRRIVLKRSDFLTSNSQFLLKQALEIFPKDRSLCLASGNGVDIEKFYPDSSLSPKELYILAMGRLHVDKGFDILLKAFSIIKSEHKNIKLFIAGDGSERERLTQLKEDLGLYEQVNFLGTVVGKQKVLLLQNALFFILPSRREPFGNVLLEAMACQKAVIATRVGGVPELVLDGEVGLLVPPEDPKALAAAIERLLQSPEKRKQMGITNRQLVERRYTWTAIAKKYEEIFRGVVNA